MCLLLWLREFLGLREGIDGSKWVWLHNQASAYDFRQFETLTSNLRLKHVTSGLYFEQGISKFPEVFINLTACQKIFKKKKYSNHWVELILLFDQFKNFKCMYVYYLKYYLIARSVPTQIYIFWIMMTMFMHTLKFKGTPNFLNIIIVYWLCSRLKTKTKKEMK